MNRLLTRKLGAAAHVNAWSMAAGAFAVIVLCIGFGYWPTIRSLIWVWAHDGTYQYAFLIFPLSIGIVFSLRHRLFAEPPQACVWGMPAVGALVAVWLVGHLLDINLVQHFALVALFPAVVLAVFGWRVAWILKFPLAYLAFAVPWGDALVGPLQDITAHIAVRALDFVGTPVLLSGHELITPTSSWLVADACSGVKFFIACTALGCLYAYLMYRQWWKRILFVLLAAVVPVIANGLRVFFTVLIGDTWGVTYATGTDHLIFGWQFFGTILLLLLLLGWFFRDPVPESGPSAHPHAGVAWSRTWIWIATLLLMLAGPVIAAGLNISGGTPAKLILAPPSVSGWRGPAPADSRWQPAFSGAAGQWFASYRSDTSGRQLEAFHAVYLGTPRRGHDLITYTNRIYDPTHAQIRAQSRHRLAAAGHVLNIQELDMTGGQGPRIIWYWYCIDGHCTDSAVVGKLLQAWQALQGRNARSSIWVVSEAYAKPDPATARADLKLFVETLMRPTPASANAAVALPGAAMRHE